MAQNGPFRKFRAVISIAILVPAAVGAAFSKPHYAIDSWQQFGFESAGWLLFLAGAGFRWWATLYVGGRKSTELVTIGPYSICRNPVYVGTFLLTLSVGVFSQSAAFVAAVAVAACAYLFLTLPVEEDGLRRRHGEEFQAYCRQVPSFFPRFSQYHSPETISLHISGLWVELIRTCRWVWIPILCNLVTHLRATEWWPMWPGGFQLP
jgi:protein-S-isoprenylcysteine O-methyltransferase Ste14